MDQAQPTAPTEETSGKAIASFVLGLLSLSTVFACPIFPVLAIAFGLGERQGLGRAGLILGWIGIAIYAGVALLALVFVLVGGLGVALGA